MCIHSPQFTFLVVEITPVSIKSIGYRTYIYFAIFNACFIPLIYFFYPESASLTLEQIDYLFTGDKVLLHMPAVSKRMSCPQSACRLTTMRFSCLQDMLHHRHGLEGADMAGSLELAPPDDKVAVEYVERPKTG